MRRTLPLISIFLLIAFGGSLASAERVQFQRQKFDRSRFQRAGTTAPAAPETAPAVVEEEPPTTEPTGHSSWQGGTEPTGGTSWQTGAAASTNQGVSIFSANPTLSDSEPPPTYWPGATAEEIAAYNSPLWDEVPGKWFKKAKQFEELQALQKKTGACMIIYFKNPTIPNQKGLCNWYEKTVTKNMKWRKAMRHYIKLEITLPGQKVTRALAEKFMAKHTPNVTVLHPGATRGTFLKLFDYEQGGRPDPHEAEDVLKQLKEASTPAYATIIK